MKISKAGLVYKNLWFDLYIQGSISFRIIISDLGENITINEYDLQKKEQN